MYALFFVIAKSLQGGLRATFIIYTKAYYGLYDDVVQIGNEPRITPFHCWKSDTSPISVVIFLRYSLNFVCKKKKNCLGAEKNNFNGIKSLLYGKVQAKLTFKCNT